MSASKYKACPCHSDAAGLVTGRPKHAMHQRIQEKMLLWMSCHMPPEACWWIHVEEDMGRIVTLSLALVGL